MSWYPRSKGTSNKDRGMIEGYRSGLEEKVAQQLDRQKHLLIKQQHPEKDVRFVFSNSRGRISKSSNTTYADWCLKNGFVFADKLIPVGWLNEPA